MRDHYGGDGKEWSFKDGGKHFLSSRSDGNNSTGADEFSHTFRDMAGHNPFADRNGYYSGSGHKGLYIPGEYIPNTGGMGTLRVNYYTGRHHHFWFNDMGTYSVEPGT